MDYGVEGVQVGVAGRHCLSRPRRHDARSDNAFLLRKSVILRRHILLLADEAVETLDVLWAQLVVLHVAIDRLRVGRAARHILQLNVIRIEVLNDANIIALLIRYLIILLHHHTAVAVLLHVRWHLGAVEAA